MPPPIQTDWLTIVNPNAGLKKAARDWKKVSYLLKRNGIRYFSVFTERRMHAFEISLEMIRKGYRKILVVGGDGTLNEVINGIFRQEDAPASEFTVAMIPVGTGNDWCRMYNIPFEYKGAVEVLLKGKTFLQDVGKVSYDEHGDRIIRYLVNMAGMGYDALVAKKTNKMKDRGRGGALVYLYNLFTSLLFYRYTNTTITIDGHSRQHRVFSMNVGICQYNGAGMKQLPKAVPDDGLFDVTIIRRIGRFAVIRNVKKLYDGSFVRLPQVLTFTGKEITIRSTPDIYLEADGESLGHSPLEYEIIPRALKVVVNEVPY